MEALLAVHQDVVPALEGRRQERAQPVDDPRRLVGVSARVDAPPPLHLACRRRGVVKLVLAVRGFDDNAHVLPFAGRIMRTLRIERTPTRPHTRFSAKPWRPPNTASPLSLQTRTCMLSDLPWENSFPKENWQVGCASFSSHLGRSSRSRGPRPGSAGRRPSSRGAPCCSPCSPRAAAWAAGWAPWRRRAPAFRRTRAQGVGGKRACAETAVKSDLGLSPSPRGKIFGPPAREKGFLPKGKPEH